MHLILIICAGICISHAFPITGISHTISKEGIINELSKAIYSLQYLFKYVTLNSRGFIANDVYSQPTFNISIITLNLTKMTPGNCDTNTFILAKKEDNLMEIKGTCTQIGFTATLTYKWEIYKYKLRVGFGSYQTTISTTDYSYSAYFTPTKVISSVLKVSFSDLTDIKTKGIGINNEVKKELAMYTKEQILPELTKYFELYSDVMPYYLINYNKYNHIKITTPWLLLDSVEFINVHPTIDIAKSYSGDDVLYVAYETTFAISNRNLYLPLPSENLKALFHVDFGFYVGVKSLDNILNYMAENTDAFEVIWTNSYITNLLKMPFTIGFINQNAHLNIQAPSFDLASLYCKPLTPFSNINEDGISITTHSSCGIYDSSKNMLVHEFLVDISSYISVDYDEKDTFLDIYLTQLKATMLKSKAGGFADMKMKMIVNEGLKLIDKMTAGKLMLSAPTTDSKYHGYAATEDMIFIYYSL